MCRALAVTSGPVFPRLRGGILLLVCLGVGGTTRAADQGEAIDAPVAYRTYTFTPGKLTGKQFWLENIEKKEKILCREFCFEQFLTYKKPQDTANILLSLRGGYRPHDLFGHDEFEAKEALGAASGWVPQSSGNFLIYPDQAKEHAPKWTPESTRLIRVPLIKQYGDQVVNAFDVALGLDRLNKGEAKAIDFQLVPLTDDSGKKGVRLVPAVALAEGVYFAFSTPSGLDADIYGFLFAVGMPGAVAGNSGSTQTQPTAGPAGTQPADAKLAREVLDYALLSQAVYDLGTTKYKAPSGWEAVGLPGLVCLVDPKKAAFIGVENGFKASVFLKGKTLAVVFQGTNPSELVDWTTDIAAAMGFEPGQYKDALNFVGRVIDEAGTKYEVVLAGHSLGGGLATFAALSKGKPAIVFNAAPMGAGMLGDVGDLSGKKSLMKNIDMKGDPVSGLGGQTGPIYWLEVPAAVQSQIDRTRLAAGPGFAVNNLGELHSIANIITALQTLSR